MLTRSLGWGGRRPLPQVALRGGVEPRKDVLGTSGKRGHPGMRQSLLDALSKVPAAAAATLVYLCECPS